MKKTYKIYLTIISVIIVLELALRATGFSILLMQEWGNRRAILKRGSYRIMCIGESTTAEWGGDCYPWQLDKILNSRSQDIQFSVINKGKVGVTTTYLALTLEDDLDAYQPDMVIAMMGINDMGQFSPGDAMASSVFARKRRPLRVLELAEDLYKFVIKKNAKKRESALFVVFEPENVPGSEKTLSNEQFQREHGKLENVEKLIKYTLAEHPGDYNAFFRLALIYRDQGRFKESEEIFMKLVNKTPDNVHLYPHIARLYMVQKKYKKSEEMFLEGLNKNPRSIGLLIDLAWIYRQQGKFDEAAKLYEKVIAIVLNGMEELNWTYLDINAIKAKRELKNAPEVVKRSYFKLGLTYQEKGDHEKAEEIYELLKGIDPYKAYIGLGLLNEKTGNADLAREYFNKAEKFNNENYHQLTRSNYNKIREILDDRGIKLVAVQYPLRNIEPLEMLLEDAGNIIFVDNKKVFENAIEEGSYDEYFIDRFAGDFGHCTKKGNRLLAENIGKAVLNNVAEK